ncbi:MAG: hypothetical protein JWP25_6674 [Bradyrhizobium sp.]|nr:hypothetical protein [Bradyrhizobium sp.]
MSNCSVLDFPNQSLTSEGVIVRELFALDIVTSVTTLIAPKGERRGIKNATIPDVYSRFRGRTLNLSPCSSTIAPSRLALVWRGPLLFA